MLFLSITEPDLLPLYLVLLAIIIFFLCRELICWYYKINERNKLLRELIDKQDETNRLLHMLGQAIETLKSGK